MRLDDIVLRWVSIWKDAIQNRKKKNRKKIKILYKMKRWIRIVGKSLINSSWFFSQFLRYQKKIGSYDKQQWEKTLEEQKIIESALSFPLRSTKLKTDLIDVDLVRGSTFPKAKPKQSLLTVLYLSILRYFFLPLYARWWVKETSAKVFVLLLTLYVLQMINLAIYSTHVKTSSDEEKVGDENPVPLCELLIPMSLAMLLCFVHSQIVATSVTSSRSTSKRRHKLNLNRVSSDKVRRKKKALR